MGSIKTVLIFLQAFYGVNMCTTHVEQAYVVSKDVVPSSGDLEVLKTGSVIQCLIACQHAEGCLSFVTHTGKSECRLYSTNSTATSYAPGGIYHVMGVKPNTPPQASVASTSTQSTTAGARKVRFEVDKTNRSYGDANANCKSTYGAGAQLACILTAEDQQKINQLITGVNGCADLRVGLEKMDNKWDMFRWLDGTIINYSDQGTQHHNWQSIYPFKWLQSSSDITIVVMKGDNLGKWGEITSDGLYCSVCEIPIK